MFIYITKRIYVNKHLDMHTDKRTEYHACKYASKTVLKTTLGILRQLVSRSRLISRDALLEKHRTWNTVTAFPPSRPRPWKAPSHFLKGYNVQSLPIMTDLKGINCFCFCFVLFCFNLAAQKWISLASDFGKDAFKLPFRLDKFSHLNNRP